MTHEIESAFNLVQEHNITFCIAGWHLHHIQLGNVRHRRVHRHHQPAAGRHPRRRIGFGTGGASF